MYIASASNPGLLVTFAVSRDFCASILSRILRFSAVPRKAKKKKKKRNYTHVSGNKIPGNSVGFDAVERGLTHFKSIVRHPCFEDNATISELDKVHFTGGRQSHMRDRQG